MPKQLNNGQITQALQRAFGFKGRYIPMLDEVIVPVYVLADPAPASVTRLCAGTQRVLAGIQDPGNEEHYFVQLLNPPGSGVIANVTNVVVASDIKQAINIALFDVEGDEDRITPFFRDTRNRGEPGCVIPRQRLAGIPLLGNELAVVDVDGALSQTASFETQAGDPRQPLVVLEEGKGLIVQNQDPQNPIVTFNDQIRVNFRWLEIPIQYTSPPGGLP